MIVEGDDAKVPAIQIEMSPLSCRQGALPRLVIRVRDSKPTAFTRPPSRSLCVTLLLEAAPASVQVRSAG